MKSWIKWSLLAILMSQANATSCSSKIPRFPFKEAFRVFAIVPQVIPVAPKAPLIRYYGDYKLNLGNRIPVAVTNSLSLYSSWPNVKANALYTMITCDLDYPQFFFNEGTQFINGIIVNIQGPNYSTGKRIIGYHPPSPLPGAGDNRILTLVYEQKAPINITTELILRTAASRETFSITEFAKRFRLGNPVAGNFYRSRQFVCASPWCKETNDCCAINCMQ